MVLARDLITTGQAADLLDCSRWTVQRLTALGDLIAAVDIPGSRMYDRSDVEALAEARRAKAAS